MALRFQASAQPDESDHIVEAMGLFEVERAIAQSLADGLPQDPGVVIKCAQALGAPSMAVVKEALWSLIGDGIIEITDQYKLLRVK